MRNFANLECFGSFVSGNMRIELPIEFVWEDRDPYAITMIIYRNKNELDLVTWTFDVNLLKWGLYNGTAGEGDVKITSLGTRICSITLGAEWENQAVFEFKWKTLRQFVDEIPMDREIEISDEDLNKLLGC